MKRSRGLAGHLSGAPRLGDDRDTGFGAGPPPGEIASMQAEIAELEARIDTLNQFLQRLQSRDGD